MSSCLKGANGTIVQIGLTGEPHSIQQYSLMVSNLSLSGSFIGTIKETQDCMDFCHQHKIIPKTKLITYKELDKVNLDNRVFRGLHELFSPGL